MKKVWKRRRKLVVTRVRPKYPRPHLRMFVMGMDSFCEIEMDPRIYGFSPHKKECIIKFIPKLTDEMPAPPKITEDFWTVDLRSN